MKKLSLLFLFCFYCISIGQLKSDSTYNIEVYLTVSPTTMSFFNKPKYPSDIKKYSIGHSFFLRTMWHPSRMLSIGFMTGYLLFSEESIPSDNNNFGSARLSAIPMQVGITMQRLGSEVGLGFGPYLMLSTLDDGINKTTSNRIEFGITFWGSYYFSLSEIFLIAPEIKFLYLGYRGIMTVMPSVSIKYYLYRY